MSKRRIEKGAQTAAMMSRRTTSNTKSRAKGARTSATAANSASSGHERLAVIMDRRLKSRCRKILDEIERQERKVAAGKKLPPWATPSNVLLKSAYRLVQRYLADGRMGVIDDAVMAVARCKLAPTNPFAQFLLLIEALKGEVSKPAKNRIRLQASTLQYVHEHRNEVPAHFLIGFIYQEGGQKRIVAMHSRRRKKR